MRGAQCTPYMVNCKFMEVWKQELPVEGAQTGVWEPAANSKLHRFLCLLDNQNNILQPIQALGNIHTGGIDI